MSGRFSLCYLSMCLIPDDFTTKFDTRLSIYSVQVIKSKPLFFHSYSIAWFKSEDAVRQAEHDLDGKYVNGCILLVKPLTGSVPVLKEAKPVDIAREEKLPGVLHRKYRMSGVPEQPGKLPLCPNSAGAKGCPL